MFIKKSDIELRDLYREGKSKFLLYKIYIKFQLKLLKNKVLLFAFFLKL